VLPGVFSLVLQLMDEYQIPNVRISDEWVPGWLFASPSLWGLKILSKWARRQSGMESFNHNDRFWGVGLKAPPRDRLLRQFLSDPSSGISELGIHLSEQAPASGSDRYDSDRKLKEMLDWITSSRVKQLLDASDMERVSWSELNRVAKAV